MSITKLVLKQDSNDVEEFLTGSIISTLFNFDSENINILLKGYIRCNRGYELDSNYLNTKYPNFHSSILTAYYKFEDSTFELFLISRGIGDGTGIMIEDMNNYNGSAYHLMFENILKNTVFPFEKMNELKYFINATNWTSLTYSNYGNYRFKYLLEVTFPYNFLCWAIPTSYPSWEDSFFYYTFGCFRNNFTFNCKIRIDYKEGYLLRGNYRFYYRNKIQESAYFPKGITESGSYDLNNIFSNWNIYEDHKIYGDTFKESGVISVVYPDYITKVYDLFMSCPNLTHVIYNENVNTVMILGIFLNTTLDVDLIFKSINVPNTVAITDGRTIYSGGYLMSVIKEKPYDDSVVTTAIGQNNVYVYVPDAVYNDYNQNMIPFKYFYDGTTGTKFDSNKWHLRRMGDYRNKMLGYGLTDEDINRQPITILEGAEG